MKTRSTVVSIWLMFVGIPGFAAQPAADVASRPSERKSGQELLALSRKAMGLEARAKLTQAADIYQAILRQCDPGQQWLQRREALQGLRRVQQLRTEFAMTRNELEQKLAKTYRDYKPQELGEWERRGWICSRVIDGQKGYSILNPTNLCFFDTPIMARNEGRAKGYRQFAQIFLDDSDRIDRLQSASSIPERYVDPVRYLMRHKVEVKQADLPPGKTVRAWFPYPLLAGAVQNIRTVSVRPAGTLKCAPDIESDIGIAYLEVKRPATEDLTIELEVTFDAYHTDCVIDPESIPPYDKESELYRRFTRSEQQMALTAPLQELARSVVGKEQNPYRKARKLYDWVCDHITYNFVWRWRDATFTFGCASEEVRERRIGDCVIQSVFYAALCRSVGVPARVCNGPIFPPGTKNDHVWAEVYLPQYGWLPVDVTYSEVASMVPGLTDAQRRRIRDFFFARMDRYRVCTQRNDLAQELVPVKRSPRFSVTMFVRPELECGGVDIEKRKITWECLPASK